MEVEAPPTTEPTGPTPLHPIGAIVGLGTIQALTMGAGLARTKVLATMLGPAGMGVASVIDQVVSLAAQVGSISLPFAALKFLSRLSTPAASSSRRQTFAAIVTMLLVASGLAASVALIIAAWHPALFADGLVPYRTALLVAIVGVPPVAVVPMLRNVMAALEAHRSASIATFLAAVATVGASYMGVQTGGLTGLYVANGIVAVATVVGMQHYVTRALGMPFTATVNVRSAVSTLRGEPGLVQFGGALYVLAFTSPIAYLLSRSTLLSTHGAVEAGWVAAAYGIAVSVRLVLHQANTLYLLPLVNRDADKSERIEVVSDYLRILTPVVALSVLGIALFPSLVLVTLYSSTFLSAASFVWIFLIAEAVLLLAGVYQSLLVGFDDTRGLLVGAVAGHLLTIALASILIRPLGAVGMGTAFLAGNSVILLGAALRLRLAHGAARLITPVPFLLVILLAIGTIGWWAAQPTVRSLWWRAAIYASACGIAFALLKPNERRWLLGGWRSPAAAP